MLELVIVVTSEPLKFELIIFLADTSVQKIS